VRELGESGEGGGEEIEEGEGVGVAVPAEEEGEVFEVEMFKAEGVGGEGEEAFPAFGLGFELMDELVVAGGELGVDFDVALHVGVVPDEGGVESGLGGFVFLENGLEKVLLSGGVVSEVGEVFVYACFG
jgi:hypothetical protein